LTLPLAPSLQGREGGYVIGFEKVNRSKLNVSLKENEKILLIKQCRRFLSSLHCREERAACLPKRQYRQGEESQEISL
jgi:hypothetical protein